VFNRAYGFSDDQIDEFSEAVAWYADGAVPGSFEITPGLSTTKLVRLLQECGYRQSGFHATFAALLNLLTTGSDDVEVRRVEGGGDLGAFADAYHLGWNLKEFRIPMDAWPDAPGWSLYIGLVGGRTAGAAILYLKGDDAYLADSAVSPHFRRHGVHLALLERRCADAANSGARTVFSGAEFLSGSHRNMIRIGLGLLCTETIWTKN
jgi:ribosomal protein S18 acetylase RimI-like enzyme